mmetsp:Transcript_14814/g.44643  ORF Transcript_14814/g.44643 Transcript_14814/m.44643 type:complete len:275 (-) Transcript_14814:299-1123(-)
MARFSIMSSRPASFFLFFWRFCFFFKRCFSFLLSFGLSLTRGCGGGDESDSEESESSSRLANAFAGGLPPLAPAAFLVRRPRGFPSNDPGISRLTDMLSSTVKLLVPQDWHFTVEHVLPPKSISTGVGSHGASFAAAVASASASASAVVFPSVPVSASGPSLSDRPSFASSSIRCTKSSCESCCCRFRNCRTCCRTRSSSDAGLTVFLPLRPPVADGRPPLCIFSSRFRKLSVTGPAIASPPPPASPAVPIPTAGSSAAASSGSAARHCTQLLK